MKCNELLKILRRGEDSYHQFKENFSRIDQLVVEISAFANSEETIKYGVHIERNLTILSLLEKDSTFHYSGRGTGIPRMIKKCREAGIKFRLINDKDTQQFCVVFNRNVPPEIRQEENSK